jgi:hypothetical protein
MVLNEKIENKKKRKERIEKGLQGVQLFFPLSILAVKLPIVGHFPIGKESGLSVELLEFFI